jgi:circadian clock protein KaiC
MKKKTKVTKKSVDKIMPTGVLNLDRLVEGGFRENSTNLVVGGSGSGKSIFVTQFLMEGMKKGEATLYVTFEEEKPEFYRNMKKLGWDLQLYEEKGLFTFLEYTPEKVKTMLEEGGGAIENIILKRKVTRVVIDSISSFALLFENELEKREAALTLFKMISKWNCTALLTLEEDPTKEEPLSTKSIEFESDSIIFLYFVRNKKERERYIEIIKMRGTNHSRNVYKFKISPTGIIVDKSPTQLRLSS